MSTGKRRLGKRFLMALGLAVLIVLCVAAYGAYSAGLILRFDRAHTLHSPIFNESGSKVYYLERHARGFSYGPGWEFFTPPATVYITHDLFTLRELDILNGSDRPLYSWVVPHDPIKKQHYRNRLFGIPFTQLNIEDGQLHYRIGLDTRWAPPPASTQREWATGTWDIKQESMTEERRWETVYLTAAPWPDEILSGPYELILYQRIAVVVHDITDDSYRILLRSKTSPISDEEILSANLAELSHRAEIERIEHLRDTRARLTRQFKEQGYPEGEALLRTSDELERMGLIPKGPKITATEVSGPQADFPVFEISDREFLVGLFQDIEKAIEAPGTEVGHWGNYVRHRDFDTSERLNGWLRDGNREFYVRTSHGLYHMTIIRQN